MISPLISIIILNFNRSRDTIECIQSLKKINYSNYKILLIDNCSSDNSFQIFNNMLNEVEIIKTTDNLGYTGGINFGLEYVSKYSPDYILVLNNDTIVNPEFLSHLADAMENDLNSVAAGGTILYEHERNKIWYASGNIIKWRGMAVHYSKGKIFDSSKHKEIIQTEFISGCMVLIRYKYLNIIGFEDDDFFMYLDDIEYSIRMKRKGFKLLYVPQSIIYHKVENENESPFKLYYSVRNRLLLISKSISGFVGIVAKTYFIFIILVKLIYWRIFNKIFYKAAKDGIKDYFNKIYSKGNGRKYLINYNNDNN